MKARRHVPRLLALGLLPLAPLIASTPAPADGAAPASASANPTPPTPAPAPPPGIARPPAPVSTPAKSTLALPLSPKFLKVRGQVDALFHYRYEAPAPPDLRYNPFRPAGAVPLAAASADGTASSAAFVSASSDLAILQEAVAMLKIRGSVQIGGRSQLVINSGPNKEGTYKEGDILNLTVQDQPVYLRVRQISRYSVMFSFKDAEVTLKF